MDPGLFVGSIVDRKYRVDRVVAEGGFGIVYAAEHLTLGVPVALKVLRPRLRQERDDWEDLIYQFQEEAKALTRLRHSHVALVLDSGLAPLGDDPMGLPWMALEWLDGETLRDHLAARRGRGGLRPAECMALLRPVLETIADAHEIGIVHRDLKPSNIMLVPTKGGLSPRVLDFGIAKMMERPTDHVPSGTTATESASPAFTIASAAPEQLAAARTGPWTDVYALGLLLTEVLTDQPPIPLEDPQERYRVVFANERPTPARLGVDVGAWEPVLARALAVKPAERPRDARALLAELDEALAQGSALAEAVIADASVSREATTRAPETAPRTWGRRVARRAAVAVLAAGALAAAGMGVSHGGFTRRDPVVFASMARPLVVVSEFGARKGDGRVASTFAELLTAQLAVGDTVRTPAPDARTGMLAAAGLGTSRPLPASGLTRLHAATGGDVIVGGEIDDVGGMLHADIDLYDAAKGTLLATLTLSGPAGDVNAFVREAGARVRRGLGRPALSIEDETALRTTLPENPEASMAYVEGLAARRAFRFRDAAAHFDRAIALAPTFAPALSSLAQAHLSLGHQDAAREAAERAVKLAPGLPRADELLVYALAAETRHDWPAAEGSYRALAQFYPDRVDYVTSLARALVGAGKSADALALLEEAKKRPRSDWDLVRIELLTSFAHARRSEDPASLAAAEEAERLAIKIGARVPRADAVLAQAHGQHRAGRLDEAEALFTHARAIYVDVGDDDNVLHCDMALAEIASVRGDFARAIAIGERVVAAHRATGNLYRLARVTVSLGLFHAAAGHLAKARALCDEGGRVYEQAHDREGEAFRWLNLAELDLRMGRADGVDAMLRRARAIHEEIGQRAGVAGADAALARAAWLRGRLAEAEAGLEVAAREAAEAGESGLRAEIALDRARLAFTRGAADERARFEEAEKLVVASSDRRLVALLDVHAARRALAAGEIAEARRRALVAEDDARKAHASDAIALSVAVALDAFAVGPRETSLSEMAGRDAETRRVELGAVAFELEAVEPRVEALLALSRASDGEEAVKVAERATRLASEHGLVTLEPLARRVLLRARARMSVRADASPRPR